MSGSVCLIGICVLLTMVVLPPKSEGVSTYGHKCIAAIRTDDTVFISTFVLCGDMKKPATTRAVHHKKWHMLILTIPCDFSCFF